MASDQIINQDTNPDQRYQPNEHDTPAKIYLRQRVLISPNNFTFNQIQHIAESYKISFATLCMNIIKATLKGELKTANGMSYADMLCQKEAEEKAKIAKKLARKKIN